MNNEKYIHEMYLATLERTIRRLWILCIVTIVLLVGTNLAWVYYESQFEDEVTTTQEVTQDNKDGANNFIGNNGDIVNGEADSKDNNDQN